MLHTSRLSKSIINIKIVDSKLPQHQRALKLNKESSIGEIVRLIIICQKECNKDEAVAKSTSFFDQESQIKRFKSRDMAKITISRFKSQKIKCHKIRSTKQGKNKAVTKTRQDHKQRQSINVKRHIFNLISGTEEVHHTFHVSNLKKCYADEPLAMPLEGIHVDDKLQFVEEPVEIMEREIKRLKRSRIPLVKVRWNSRRGPEFTWECEDSFKKKYPHLFTNRASSSTTRS
ncbi:hypothetical protein Tco_0359564 [Tanacetum coccineum]